MSEEGVAVAERGGQIDIVHGDQQVAVVELGGGLRSFEVGGRALLDGFPAGARPTSGRGQVLAPWPNRIENGSYEFNGQRLQLPLTEPEHGNAIHGLVRGATWDVVDLAPDSVALEFVLEPQPGYPFTLALRIEYSLSEAGLSVQTTAWNAGSEPCPFGSGQHPYLTLGTPSVDTLRLQVPAQVVVYSDDRGLPVRSEPVAGTEFDFRRKRAVGATVLDHCFTGLKRGSTGVAQVHLNTANRGVTLWVDQAFDYLMLFTGDPLPDVARRALAVEPMTCPPNAFQSGVSVITLAPGKSFTGSWGITPG